jgi:sulfonate transport system ATP-binding protein
LFDNIICASGLLADRALVLAEDRIAAEIAIDLERPRRHTDHRFGIVRSKLLEELGIGDADEDRAAD